LLTFSSFNIEYPFLAQFAREKSWKCGKVFISIRHKCYTDPKTGKVNYKKIVNPKTGRTNRVKVGIDYNTYRKQRSAAIKRLGQIRRGKVSGLGRQAKLEELLLTNDVYSLKDRTRVKNARIRDRRLLKESLKSAKTINQDWKKIPHSYSMQSKNGQIVRSHLERGIKGYGDVTYKIGKNRIDMIADQSDTLDYLLEKTNIRDLFKAKKLDFDKIKPPIFDINTKVNGVFASDNADIIPLANKNFVQTNIKVVQAATKAHNQILDSLPDIAIAHNSPFMVDGKGLAREKLYNRLGYGTVLKNKHITRQALVKIGKKIYPLARKAFK